MNLRRIAISFAAAAALAASLGLPQAQAAPMDQPAPPTCAEGGVCQVGDIGPGGGVVIYAGGTVINAVAPISTGGIYLEAAPADWYQGGDFMGWWCPYEHVVVGQAPPLGTQAAIGTGALNTFKMSKKCTYTDGLGTIVGLTLNGYSDWFLPSEEELMAFVAAGVPLNTAFTDCYGGACYWSSTETNPTDPSSTSIRAMNNVTGPWVMGNNTRSYWNTFFRPIRAFGNPLPTTAKPTMSKPTLLKVGFRLQINNFTSSCRWSAQSTEGRAAVSPSGVVSVTGLTPGQASTVTVIKRCTGYQAAWNAKTSRAKP